MKALPRHPGTKETRYVHLLSGHVERWESPSVVQPNADVGSTDDEKTKKLEELEEEVAALRNEIAELKQQFASFRKQFE